MGKKIVFSKKMGVCQGKQKATIVHTIEKKTAAGEYMVAVAFSIGGEIIWKNFVFPNEDDTNLTKKEYLNGQNQKFLKLIGQPHEGAVDVEPKQWTGKEVGVEIKKEMYNGEERNIISSFFNTEIDTNMPKGLEAVLDLMHLKF